MIRPVFNDGDDVLTYIARIQEWERIQNGDAQQECREIDRLARRRIMTERVVSMETRAQRISIHELAENNPVLRNILRNRA